MKCSYCGNENEEHASFCRMCGKSLDDDEKNVVEDEISKVLNDDTFVLKKDTNNTESIDDKKNTNKFQKESLNKKVKKDSKSENKPLIISIVIAAIVLVALVLVMAFVVINPSPDKVFKTSVDRLFSGLEERVLEDQKIPMVLILKLPR